MRGSGEGRDRRRSTPPLADIQVDLTRLVYEQALALTILSGVSLVSCTFALGAYYHDAWLRQLSVLMLLFVAGRIVLVLSFEYFGHRALTVQHGRRWELAFGSTLVMFGALNAMLTVHDFRFHPGFASTLSIVGTFAYCNAVSERLGVRPAMPIAAGVFMLAALAAGFFMLDDRLMRWADVIVVFYAYSYCKAINMKFGVIVEQLRSRRKFRELAERDALTGLANRRSFAGALEAACRERTAFALLAVDLDGFKGVNDTFGHAAGDELLVAVAARLRSITRDTDVVARLGGDEFAIVQTPALDRDGTRSLAQRVVNALARPFPIGGTDVVIGASIGIWWSQGTNCDPEAVLRSADGALYLAKDSGKGGFCFA